MATTTTPKPGAVFPPRLSVQLPVCVHPEKAAYETLEEAEHALVKIFYSPTRTAVFPTRAYACRVNGTRLGHFHLTHLPLIGDNR